MTFVVPRGFGFSEVPPIRNFRDFIMITESRVCKGRGFCSQSRLHAAKSVPYGLRVEAVSGARGDAASEKEGTIFSGCALYAHKLVHCGTRRWFLQSACVSLLIGDAGLSNCRLVADSVLATCVRLFCPIKTTTTTRQTGDAWRRGRTL